jgi:S-adenosylmethionine synthetase
MKIWVTGASGLSGRAVSAILSKEHNVVKTAFSRVSQDVSKVDLTSPSEVELFLDQEKPDAVIHLAAERKPDVCENQQDLTESLNVTASRDLAKMCQERDIWFLYMSTDYVFDGKNPPYFPDSETNPLNFYGLTKLNGEKAVVKANPRSCILRVSVLYGEVQDLGESAITVIAKALLSDQEVKADHWAPRNPILVDDIGKVILNMLGDMPAGIFHYCGENTMTKYETVLLMGNILGMSTANISPLVEPTGGAPRPQDVRLDMTLLKEKGYYVKPTDFSSVIGSLLRPHM